MAKNKKIKLNKSFLFRVAVVCFVIYVLVGFVSLQIEISNKREQLEAINAQIEEANQQNQEYQNILDSADDSEYIEKYAREKLGYSYANEKVFIDAVGN